MFSLATYITANQCSHLTCRRFWARFPGLTSVKQKSKVLTVLKSTKLLHEHTIYLLICVQHGLEWHDIVKEILSLPRGHCNKKCFENGTNSTH